MPSFLPSCARSLPATACVQKLRPRPNKGSETSKPIQTHRCLKYSKYPISIAGFSPTDAERRFPCNLEHPRKAKSSAFPNVFAAGACDRVRGMFLGHRLMADGTELTPDQVAKRIVFGSGSWFGWYWEMVLHTRAEHATVGFPMGVPRRSACQGRLGRCRERSASVLPFKAWRKQGIEGPHSEPRFSEHMRCRYVWSVAELATTRCNTLS